VPDGNGRWAEKRGLSRLEGHKAGATNLSEVIKTLNDYSIRFVTVYSFSTENWSRPPAEIDGLFRLTEVMINQELERLSRIGVRFRHLGRLQGLPPGLQKAITGAVEGTRENTGLTLSFAFNYGGRTEILDAVRRIITDKVPAEDIDEKLFSGYLYTTGLPDVDLLIRTGDELRLSNYLIWQTVYSEYYFTRTLWPDFDAKGVRRSLLAYSKRHRRFGGL
jgi:undecaprenyl diphosphate synthase